MDDFIKNLSNFKPVDDKLKISAEKHGSGYAIYLGRGQFSHGLNVAFLTEVDKIHIDKALNKINNYELMKEHLSYLVNSLNNNTEIDKETLNNMTLFLNSLEK